jgi:hypothetical protein
MIVRRVGKLAGETALKLVANRECGECTVCCKAPLIDHPALQKLPGILCPNCKEGAGCQIYAMRPAPCREFNCGWRVMPELGDELRPDRSGILIRHTTEHIPPGLAPVGLYFLLHKQTDVIGPGFANYLCRLVAQRIAVFFSIRGPDGFSDGGVLLNGHLGPVLGDANKALRVLHDALEALSKNKFEPAIFKHGKPALTR